MYVAKKKQPKAAVEQPYTAMKRSPSQHSFKLDMASVHSMKTLDLEEELKRKEDKKKLKKSEREAKRQEIARSKSWRNPDKFVKDECDTS